MAAAMARGWRDSSDSHRLVFCDAGSGRAETLAGDLGGEAVGSIEALVERAELVVLAVKPAALEQVAPELVGARLVLSVLGATSLGRLREKLGDTPVIRLMANLGVAARAGVICHSGAEVPAPRLSEPALDALAEIATLFAISEEQLDAATAVTACSPAYFARLAGALVDAATGLGIEPQLAARLVGLTAHGSGELLLDRPAAALALAVASPGGSTEAGLAALDAAGFDVAIAAAVEASIERMGQ